MIAWTPLFYPNKLMLIWHEKEKTILILKLLQQQRHSDRDCRNPDYRDVFVAFAIRGFRISAIPREARPEHVLAEPENITQIGRSKTITDEN
ncbi:MAG: hypothetical protein ABL903_06580 [Methylococcales bacterium]